MILGIVGESGAGKSTIGHAILSALKEGGESTGEILLYGKNILSLNAEEKRLLRGNDIAVIVQDAFSSLNPLLRKCECNDDPLTLPPRNLKGVSADEFFCGGQIHIPHAFEYNAFYFFLGLRKIHPCKVDCRIRKTPTRHMV
jgi:ABC-type oligopeptide transport system ATPase subunit